MMFLMFLLFQSNIYVVLAREKGLENSVHRDLFKIKTLNKKPPVLQLRFTRLTLHVYPFS